MASHEPHEFASRAGEKLDHALTSFGVSPQGWTCADLGCSTGGFVDCLLRHGAAKLYAVDRGYGVLAYQLRNDPRVVVMERTDALHLHLPEPVRLITIDTGWTRQRQILPAARDLLAADGIIISLIKPHYEAVGSMLRGGVLPDESVGAVLAEVRTDVAATGLRLLAEIESPIRGHGGNREFLWHLVSA
ncbi:MAG TPA: SAM-dependent methyltransferase [Phycisphaerae bacterium]|nr:SAM-dependent methyltransferase [Phycisphaerae bacterium]